MPAERLQKIIAAAGVASRRKAEELIASGRVLVNGQVVTELGTKADPEQDHIRVDGKLLQGPERFTYVVLNKPKGYVTTVSDEKKRPTVMDLVQKVKGRVYPVGRLDWASEGLLLMTNDGALANALMKAASNVAKVYVVKVAGQPDETKLDKLRRGVSIAEKGGRRVRTAPAKIRLIREGDNPWLEVTIIEGRNRQVRRSGPPRGENPARAVWSPRARRAAGRLAQPYSAGSSQAENRSVGTARCRAAKPTDTAARTESYNHQAAAHTEAGKFIAPIEVPASTASTQTVAPVAPVARIKTWHFQTVAHAEAQARLALCLGNHRQPGRAVQAGIAPQQRAGDDGLVAGASLHVRGSALVGGRRIVRRGGGIHQGAPPQLLEDRGRKSFPRARDASANHVNRQV
jgi:23S rRNA pseudouridine2605 synthase